MATRTTKPAEGADMEHPQDTPNGSGDSLEFGGELARLLGQAQRPQRWAITNPSEGASIPEDAFVLTGYPVSMAGLVVAIESMPTKFGTMPVYVLDVGKGPDFPLIRFALTAELLRNAHTRHGVKVGDTIAAHCRGKRQGREQVYEDWSMIVQKGPEGTPSADEPSF